MATLQVSFTTADDKVDGIKDDFCAQYGYKATIDGQPNPETKNQFIKRKIGEFIKESVKAYRTYAAAESARTTAISNAETGVVLS